jgi:hypothetical protein
MKLLFSSKINDIFNEKVDYKLKFIKNVYKSSFYIPINSNYKYLSK